MTTANTQAKFEARIAEGDHYATLQTINALIVRAQKKGDLKKASDLGRSGALAMLKHGYGNAGLDLSLNLIESWKAANKPVDDEAIATVKDISDEFLSGVKDPKEATKLLGKFISAAIEWSKTGGEGSEVYINGEPKFHHIAAKAKIKAADPQGANDHYVHSHQPKEFAAFLYQLSTRGYNNERDLFVCRAVLELLSYENLSDANVVFETYTALAISKKKTIDSPIFNFIRFLLRTLERDAYPLFQVLREKYGPSLRSDPSFDFYLDKVGDRFFGVKPKKQGMAAMIESMFGGAQ